MRLNGAYIKVSYLIYVCISNVFCISSYKGLENYYNAATKFMNDRPIMNKFSLVLPPLVKNKSLKERDDDNHHFLPRHRSPYYAPKNHQRNGVRHSNQNNRLKYEGNFHPSSHYSDNTQQQRLRGYHPLDNSLPQNIPIPTPQLFNESPPNPRININHFTRLQNPKTMRITHQFNESPAKSNQRYYPKTLRTTHPIKQSPAKPKRKYPKTIRTIPQFNGSPLKPKIKYNPVDDSHYNKIPASKLFNNFRPKQASIGNIFDSSPPKSTIDNFFRPIMQTIQPNNNNNPVLNDNVLNPENLENLKSNDSVVKTKDSKGKFKKENESNENPNKTEFDVETELNDDEKSKPFVLNTTRDQTTIEQISDDPNHYPHQYAIEIRWKNDNNADFMVNSPVGDNGEREVHSSKDFEDSKYRLFEHKEEEHWHQKKWLNEGLRQGFMDGKAVPLDTARPAVNLDGKRNYGPIPLYAQPVDDEATLAEINSHFAMPTPSFRVNNRFVNWAQAIIDLNRPDHRFTLPLASYHYYR